MTRPKDYVLKGRDYSTAISRWAGVGPYYAMFPVDFAFSVVERYAPVGGRVLDPFAGRASSVFAAAANGQTAVGIEINPVGWIYGAVKLRPAPKHDVLARLTEIAWVAKSDEGRNALKNAELPLFFRWCFSPKVLRFLAVCREELQWRRNTIDRTLMAFVLVYLHGKRAASLSNQMRDGKAMAPDYAIRWWKERGLRPPNVDPYLFLNQRIEWRYKMGAPRFAESGVRLGNSVKILADMRREVTAGNMKPFDLLFTSPPYMGVTDYFYDQWLRRWMLGAPSRPEPTGGEYEGRFSTQVGYKILLEKVLGATSEVLRRKATIYIRTDAREFTLATTRDVLRTFFPRKRVQLIRRPLTQQTQTALFGDLSGKPGEVDLILTGNA